MTHRTVDVWIATRVRDVAWIEARAAWLDAAERMRAARLLAAADRRNFIVGRVVLREILAERLGLLPQDLTFSVGDGGRPELAIPAAEDLRFSVSHSGPWIAVAIVPEREVGVDIEVLRPLARGITSVWRTLAVEERAALRALPPGARQAAFWRCWTRKEALLKGIGTGIAGGLQRCAVSLEPECPRVLRLDTALSRRSWRLAVLDGGGFGLVGAVAAEGNAPLRISFRKHPGG